MNLKKNNIVEPKHTNKTLKILNYIGARDYLACPFSRAKFDVSAGLNPPLFPPTFNPVPTNGVIGIPEFEFGLN
jgi:hypothetical protein